MAQQNTFTLPPNTNFGVTAFTNAGWTQKITVLVDGQLRATFEGSGTTDKYLGTQILNSGQGNVVVQVSVNGRPSDMVSNRIVMANKLNFVLIGSEDSTDADYNDGIAILNWPLG